MKQLHRRRSKFLECVSTWIKQCALRWNVEKGFSTLGEHLLSKISKLSLIKGMVTTRTTSRQTTIHTQSYRTLRLPDSPHGHCFWTAGGSWRIRRESTQARGEHADSTQKGIKAVTLLLWGNRLITAPPCQIVPNVSSSFFFFFSNREANRQSGGRQCVCQTYVLQSAIFKRQQTTGFYKATFEIVALFHCQSWMLAQLVDKTQFRYVQCFPKQSSCWNIHVVNNRLCYNTF